MAINCVLYVVIPEGVVEEALEHMDALIKTGADEEAAARTAKGFVLSMAEIRSEPAA